MFLQIRYHHILGLLHKEGLNNSMLCCIATHYINVAHLRLRVVPAGA